VKIWNGYGSDHSSSLMIIGHFKASTDAEKTMALIEELTSTAGNDLAAGSIEYLEDNDDFSEATREKLRELNLYSLSPSEIADFALLNASPRVEGSDIRIFSDDVEIGGFIKLMVLRGAKVEVFSTHDHPIGDEK